jgi:hypothetical protein
VTPGRPDRPRLSARVRAAYRRVESLHDDYFVGRWRAGFSREAARQSDVMLALLFLDALGVDNPAGYWTLELYPEVVERFHQWHRRMGVERFGDAGTCC